MIKGSSVIVDTLMTKFSILVKIHNPFLLVFLVWLKVVVVVTYSHGYSDVGTVAFIILK